MPTNVRPPYDAELAAALALVNDQLPSTFIDVGSAEVFRDEAVAYAGQIWADGGVAELHVWPGGFHGFDLMAPHAQIAQTAMQTRTGWVARHFSA